MWRGTSSLLTKSTEIDLYGTTDLIVVVPCQPHLKNTCKSKESFKTNDQLPGLTKTHLNVKFLENVKGN